jgi:hypothetical protein
MLIVQYREKKKKWTSLFRGRERVRVCANMGEKFVVGGERIFSFFFVCMKRAPLTGKERGVSVEKGKRIDGGRRSAIYTSGSGQQACPSLTCTWDKWAERTGGGGRSPLVARVWGERSQ